LAELEEVVRRKEEVVRELREVGRLKDEVLLEVGRGME
jgi:hypothetical protein